MTTTTQNFSIPAVDLKAMLNFAAKNDVRYYLNGLYFVPTTGGLAIQSTDGHIAGVLHIEHEPVFFQPFIIQRDDIERLKLGNKGFVQFEVSEHDTNSNPVKIQYTGATIMAQPIDGQYPDVQRVFPKDSNGEVAFFDPALLTRFVKAAKLLGSTGKVPMTLHYNGPQAARVSMSGCHRFVGCIMPIRNAVPELGELPTPGWFDSMPRS